MGRAGVDYYFLEESGDAFKCTIIYSPYFLIGCLVSR
jgi:DNA polymerase epsilon subunit 1